VSVQRPPPHNLL